MSESGRYPPSIQAGIPKLGDKPNGWIELRFRDILNPIYRSAEIDDDIEYQLVISKRNRGGILPRERLLGKKIKTKTQFFIKENDFLISRRQIIHGACHSRQSMLLP